MFHVSLKTSHESVVCWADRLLPHQSS